MSTRARGRNVKAKVRNVDPLLEIRRRFKAFLGAIGVQGAYDAMPKYVREQFFAARGPDPLLVIDESFPTAEAHGRRYAALHQTVRDGFKRTAVATRKLTITFRDFYGIAVGLRAAVRQNRDVYALALPDRQKFPASVLAFYEAALPILDAIVCDEMQSALTDALHREVLIPLVSASRLDGLLLHARVYQERLTRGGLQVMVRLCAERSPMKYVRLEKGSRPMHRVGTPNTWTGIDYVTWTPEALGPGWTAELRLAPDARLPVYVQSHALEQLRARMNVYSYADWVEHWLCESLRCPTIAERQPDGDLLVPLKIRGLRVGYLVVTPLKDLVAVRTFLFLTMSRTPEGRQLERRLKLTRDEITYLGLHELSRFTRTDLKDDEQLRRLLTECGCGHLFKLAEEEQALDPLACFTDPIPFAAELKHYVGMAA